MQITECQENTLEAFRKFLRNPDELVLSISGDAGTGKTHLISLMEDYIKEHNTLMQALDLHSLLVTTSYKAAFTNMAANAIGGMTLHSLFGIDFKDPTKNLLPFIMINSVVFIDESSMIAASIYNEILDAARICECKIVFLGDKNQLYPVKESMSKVFTEHPVIHLTTVVRQDMQSEFYKSVEAAKEAIYNDDIALDPHDDLILVDNEEVFADMLKSEFNLKPSYNALLVYTNKQRQKYECITSIPKYVYFNNAPIGRSLLSDSIEYQRLPVTTIHKAQGKTFDRVFIDYRDISLSNESRRMFYVALSRARYGAVVLI